MSDATTEPVKQTPSIAKQLLTSMPPVAIIELAKSLQYLEQVLIDAPSKPQIKAEEITPTMQGEHEKN